MGGGGFMHEANKRIQQNRNKLNRSSLFDRNNLNKPGKSKTYLKQEKISPEKLSALMHRVAERNKATNRRLVRNLIISAILGVILVLCMVVWFTT